MLGTSTLIRWAAGVLLVVLVVLGIYYKGRLDEREIFNRYKAEVKATAMAQEEQTKRINAKNQKLLEETKNAYNTKLSTLRSYYSMRIAGQGSGGLPKVPGTPGGIDGTTTYELPPLPPVETLAAQCAETTLTLSTLQDWVKGVYNNQ